MEVTNFITEDFLAMPEKGLVHKQEALQFLRKTLLNRNVKELANSYSVPISFGQKINKGWIGQTIERHLGLQNNGMNEPDGFDYELKTTEVFFKDNAWVAKETVKITQMNPSSILQEEFESSVFWKKLKALILVTYEKKEDCFVCRNVLDIYLSDESLVAEIKQFWEDVRNAVCSGEIRDFINLGSSDSLIQLRPQGDGKQKSVCPISREKFPARSFYATKRLVNQLIDQK